MDTDEHRLGERAPSHLRTPRLVLSRIGAGDLDDLVRMYANADVMATLGGLRTAEQTAGYLEKQMAHWDEHGFGFWSARDIKSGQFVGRGGLRFATIEGETAIEVGYGLMSEFWGKGLATELAVESVRVAFAEMGMPELVCFTLTTNLASRRVMEKAGFVYERDCIYADMPHILCRQKAEPWLAAQ